MSVALFDLGQRLRSATLARPVARSTFAPVLPPIDPVAITLSGGDPDAHVGAAAAHELDVLDPANSACCADGRIAR